MLRYFSKQMLKILIDVKLISFSCLYDTVQDSTGFDSVNGINELLVFLPNAKRPDSLLCQVVIEWYLRVSKEYP